MFMRSPPLQVGLALLAVSAVGVVRLGRDLARYALGFPVVYGLSWLAQVLAGNAVVHHYGVEYVIFAQPTVPVVDEASST